MSDIGGTSSDSGMMRVMAMVGFALLLLGLSIGLIANYIGDGSGGDQSDALLQNALIERIEPVGRVRTSAEDLPEAASTVADAGGAERSGEELVNGICASCHAAGVSGAPKLGDEAAWATRREQGLETLVASVVNGLGVMPPRGGSDYSDEEITRAVKHIALFEPDPADAATDDAATDDAATDDAAAMDPAAAPTGTEADAAPATPDAQPDSDEGASASADAPASDQSAEEIATQATTESVNEANPAIVAAAAVVGEAPADLPDHVKTTVDGLCSGCHIAGVAGAPKIGDTAAWQERADKGLDTLVASVVNGMNTMPPRGGSTLTDQEIPVAIQYLMSK